MTTETGPTLHGMRKDDQPEDPPDEEENVPEGLKPKPQDDDDD